MKERPILFSAPMVRAILDGSKTQTRRIVKNATGPFWEHTGYRIVMRDGFTFWETHGGIPNEYGPAIACPYGKPGDRLWVRETWGVFEETRKCIPHYRATHQTDISPRWRPSIHMPRWASRITLEVIGVAVERLKDINEGDARAEGVTLDFAHGIGCTCGEYRCRFGSLWESINGPGSWEANPWVWVVEFKRIAP